MSSLCSLTHISLWDRYSDTVLYGTIYVIVACGYASSSLRSGTLWVGTTKCPLYLLRLEVSICTDEGESVSMWGEVGVSGKDVPWAHRI